MITIYNRNDANITLEIDPKDGYTLEWTTFAPPEQVEGSTLKFIGNKWIYIENEQIKKNDLIKLKENIIKQVQNHLDNKAKELSYENIFTMCSYKDSTIDQWREESEKAIKWRDDVWIKCYDLLQKTEQNEINIQCFEEVLSQLPKYQ